MQNQSTDGDTNADLPPLPMGWATWKTIANQLGLSPQQTRIVELILRGQQDKEIALLLDLSLPYRPNLSQANFRPRRSLQPRWSSPPHFCDGAKASHNAESTILMTASLLPSKLLACSRCWLALLFGNHLPRSR